MTKAFLSAVFACALVANALSQTFALRPGQSPSQVPVPQLSELPGGVLLALPLASLDFLSTPSLVAGPASAPTAPAPVVAAETSGEEASAAAAATFDHAGTFETDAVPEFAALADAGYAVAPMGTIMKPVEETLLRRFISRAAPNGFRHLRISGSEISLNEPIPVTDAEASEVAGTLKAVSDRLLEQLKKILPQENLHFEHVELRYTDGEKPLGFKPHLDGNYLTATISLEGPGTVIYDDSEGTPPHVVAVPTGLIAVITNAVREAAVGVRATMHSAPNEILNGRIAIIIRYGGLSAERSRLLEELGIARREAVLDFIGLKKR